MIVTVQRDCVNLSGLGAAQKVGGAVLGMSQWVLECELGDCVWTLAPSFLALSLHFASRCHELCSTTAVQLDVSALGLPARERNPLKP